MMKYMSGRFNPKHPEKYVGDPNNIFYRSSWELRVMSHFDRNQNVIQWASEELNIKYFDPVQNKIRRYFPDFVIKVKNKDGIVETTIIEVKPYKETLEPNIPSGKQNKYKKYLTEVSRWGTNQAKWKAADEYCKNHGWKFKIITEKELGL